MSGVNASTLKARFQRWDVYPDEPPIVRPRRPIKHDYPRWLINEMYWGCGLSTGAIAYELDITHGAVISIMNRFNIPRRTQSEAMKLYISRHPWTPACATPEQALIATQASAKARRRRANQRKRTRKWRQARKEAA